MSPLSSALMLLIASLCPFLCTLLWSRKHYRNDRKLPPGPQPLPLIGNLHRLGTLPHRNLYDLAKKYGHIMLMRLGNVPTIVVSSAQAAELFLKTHDSAFATRPKGQASMHMSYGTKGLPFTEYGPYWRTVKKLFTSQLLKPSKIDYFAPLRREVVAFSVDAIRKAATRQISVDITEIVDDLISNITYRMLFGQQNNDQIELGSLVKEFMYLSGAFNVADYVPVFGALDLQGLTERMKAFNRSMDEVLEKIIDEHEQDNRWEENQQKDFVDALLSFMNSGTNSRDDDDGAFDRSNVKAIILDMIVGTIDTSATTIEWTFAELLRHPNVMKSVQEELQNVVGMDRVVDEIHLSMLPYLDMVIKESYRLHPAAPLLLPRESMEDITIHGYYIPKKSRIIVNAWAIGRDPNAWPGDIEEFVPERFRDTNIDLRGHNFQLIPFGSGRRVCPGMQLGLTVVKLVLAQLLHCFNWELPNCISPAELDMKETFGLTTKRASNLLAVPTYRLSI